MAKARKRRSRKRKSTGEQGGLNLGQSVLFIYLAFSLLLIGAAFLSQLPLLSTLQMQQGTIATSVAERISHKLALNVAYYSQALRGIAVDPQIRQLILSGDATAKASKAQELQQQFPGALRLRLLPAGVFSQDRSTEPHLGFACLDMQRQAEKTGQAPPVEVHVFGTPQQHLDIQQPVLSGDKVIGHVQLALDVKVINNWLQEIDETAYVELAQDVAGKAGTMLGTMGNGSLKAEGREAEAMIAGTAWKVRVWAPIAVPPLFNVNFLTIILAGMLIGGLVVWLIKRSFTRTLQNDIETFMQIEANYLRGIKRHEFNLSMPEFKTATGRLDNLMQTGSMERERDSDPNAISLADISMSGSGTVETVFTHTSVMDVKELDMSADEIRQMTQARSPEEATASPQTELPGVPPADIFKAYDIRGIVGRGLTAQYMMLIGQALGSEAIGRGLGSIAFARDGRLSGPELGGALVKGLQAAGVDVLDVGMVPTPVLYYAAAEKTEGTGVMLTGSHNPPDYNGIKMVLGGETLSGDTIQSLRERIVNKDFTRGEGGYNTYAITDEYINRIVSDVKLKRKLKIVIDCGNGVAGAVAPKLFKALGCDVFELYSKVDGTFPNHHPDPSKPENLRDLIESVRIQNADLGMAFDGDGDRLGVVSPNGSIIWPDRLMMLFAADVLSRHHGAQIIYDIKCSSNLTKVIWEKGGEPLMWKTGHSLIKAKMKQSGALLAGEMSGHIFFKERWYGFDDGLYSGARLLEIISASDKPPHEIFGALPDAVNTPELNLNMAEGEHHKFMEAMLDQADFPGGNITMIDGIRVDYEDGWGLVRASNTTPCLVIRFEAKTKEAMQRIQDEFRKTMLAINPSLKLPF